MTTRPTRIVLLAFALLTGHAGAEAPAHDQALAALTAPDPIDRFVAIERLADLGTQEDADAVLARLSDADPRVRLAAGNAIWRIWSRSGNEAIDEQLARGVESMNTGALDEALEAFNAVVRDRPDFAEGWNKRATVYYLLGRDKESLADCDKVLALNPRHFGALGGAAQIHLRGGRPQQALEYFRRAVAVNPNLSGATQMIPLLEKLMTRRDKNMI